MLYLVATPIGNLKDITLRALEVLKKVDRIACEDKRVSSKLLTHYDISKPLFSYHEHNAAQVRGQLLEFLKAGEEIAYITDGGMPLISDPGFKLVLACQAENIPYTVIPGPSSPLTALSLSGLSPARFFFCGFLPPKGGARLQAFQDFKNVHATLIFLESPKRVTAFLKDAIKALGDREGAVCREMTKVYEEARKAPLSSLLSHYEAHPPKGEVVIVIEGMGETQQVSEEAIDEALKEMLKKTTLKEAAELVSESFGLSKREVYQRALLLKS